MALNAVDVAVHPSLRDSFIPLPTDPDVHLTPEQLNAVFPNPQVWRDVIQLTLASIEGIQRNDKNPPSEASL